MSGKWTVNKVGKNGAEEQASKMVQKRCGRCGTAVEQSSFCPACREFFRMLSGQNVIFATVVSKRHRV